MLKLKIIGLDMGPEECIPYVEIMEEDGRVIGATYSERDARLFAEASEMYDLIKKNEAVLGKEAMKLIERV